MKKVIQTSILSTLAVFSSINANAADATTAPVGGVTFTVNANSDQRLGITLQRPASFVGASSTVSGTTVNTAATVGDVTTATHYLLVTSGTAQGKWERVTASTASSVTIEAAITGFANGDSFAVHPYWTLNTLFPSGAGVPVSSDLLSPVSLVLLNNPSAVGVNISASAGYVYHDGSQLPVGWYNVSDFSPADNVLVSPEVSIAIRNQTGSSAVPVITGAVPVVPFENSIVSRSAGAQDNLVYNPYPVSLTLATSGLKTSGAVSVSSDLLSPTDLVLVYSASTSGLNPSAIAGYVYHDGSQLPEGWYNINDFTNADAVVIQSGCSIVIRKVAGVDSVSGWKPSLPYSL